MLRLSIFLTFIFSGITLLGAETRNYGSIETFAQLLGKGGPIMIPLYALSFIGVCLIFYYFFSLRIEILAPKDFMQKAENALIDKDIELLMGICDDDNSVISGIIESGLPLAKKSTNFLLVKSLIEDEGSRQSSLLWQRINYLYDIAVISPMIGLLGTVLGMMQSFIGLQAESAIPQQTQITSGISMALITTAAGLVIGIVAMIIYAYFRGRLTRIIAEIEYRCNKLLILISE